MYIDAKRHARVFACSDLHGDFLLLMVYLRDCACVIRKAGYDAATADGPDPDLDARLSRGGFDAGETYGYEWCGGTNAVVVVGDMIDNVRPGTVADRHDPTRRNGEYPHEELRLLAFLNAVSAMAEPAGGRIYKLVGNHELANMCAHDMYFRERFVPLYTSAFSRRRGTGRAVAFLPGNLGARLLVEGGVYAVLQIGDHVFVHGGLSGEFLPSSPCVWPDLDRINLNLVSYLRGEAAECLLLRHRTLVETRAFGFGDFVGDGGALCAQLETQLRRLCRGDGLSMVIGHCVQGAMCAQGTAYTPLPGPGGRRVPQAGGPCRAGITAECAVPGAPHRARVYRIDVGASRAFDSQSDVVAILRRQWSDTLLARLPQMLVVERDGSAHAIRTTPEHAFRHQPR